MTVCGRIVQTLNNIANDIIKWPINLKLTASKEKFIHLRRTPMPVIGTLFHIDKETKYLGFFIFEYLLFKSCFI